MELFLNKKSLIPTQYYYQAFVVNLIKRSVYIYN